MFMFIDGGCQSQEVGGGRNGEIFVKGYNVSLMQDE